MWVFVTLDPLNRKKFNILKILSNLDIKFNVSLKKVYMLGLTQTGDKSPYYKQIYLGNTRVFQIRVVRSSAIHCALCKSYMLQKHK